jgi:hypothetical protein
MRLAFTVPDLAETRFTVSPLRHAVFASLCIHHPGLAAPGSVWRDVHRAVPPRTVPLLDLLRHTGVRGTLAGRLLWLEPPPIITGKPTIGDELDAMLALGTTAEPPPQWEAGGDLWRLMSPGLDPELAMDTERMLRALADCLYLIFHRFLAAEWPGMRRRLEADLAHRTEQSFAHGLGDTLAALSPRLSWDGTSLHVEGAHPGTAGLRGRGLLVSPIMSAAPGYLAITLSPDGRRSLLSYPVPGDRVRPERTARPDTLAALVGPARARVLRMLGSGCGTDELAARLGVSPSTASEHAAILRNAGLLATRRQGRAVRHVLTGLGARLLDLNA